MLFLYLALILPFVFRGAKVTYFFEITKLFTHFHENVHKKCPYKGLFSIFVVKHLVVVIPSEHQRVNEGIHSTTVFLGGSACTFLAVYES